MPRRYAPSNDQGDRLSSLRALLGNLTAMATPPRMNDVISKALMHPLKRSFMERFAGLGAYLEAWLSLNHDKNVDDYDAKRQLSKGPPEGQSLASNRSLA